MRDALGGSVAGAEAQLSRRYHAGRNALPTRRRGGVYTHRRHLQRALNRFVGPAQLTEAQFWDNFFSHVDVIKVRIVTDFLSAQDMEERGRAKRHAE